MVGVVAMIGLGACATTHAPEPDPAIPALVKAADSVQDAWARLASVEGARYPRAAAIEVPAHPAPAGLDRRVSLDWTGPALPAIAKLVAMSPYKLSVLGAIPPMTPIITLHAKNETLFALLREAGYQMGTLADVWVDVSRRTVTVQFPTVQPNQTARDTEHAHGS